MRVRVPKPIRTWLQPDKLSDLLAAVALVDAAGYSPRTARINELRDRGEPPARIAAALGLSVQTVYYHLAKPAPDVEQMGEGRALLTLLSYGGLRIGEALALRWRDVRLHAAPRRLDVLDAKTPTGVREVHLSPELADVLIRYRDVRAQRPGRSSPSGEDLVWPSRDGRRRSHTWALRRVHRAADVTSETRARASATAERDAAHPAPHLHLDPAARDDNVLYVMQQVGHEDQDTTNRIYRHLIRQRQQHGAAFDRVVAEAREAFGKPAPRGAIGG